MRIVHYILAAASVTGCVAGTEDDNPSNIDDAIEAKLVQPSGPYADWSFSQPLYNLDSHLVVTTAPSATTTEFWSTQFGFQNSPGGYMGLQNAGDLPSGGIGKMAIVSIWGATGAHQENGGACSTFDELGGTGYTCRLAYNWVPNHDYRMRAWSVSSTDWVFAVADMTTGVEIQFGSISVPGPWGWIDNSDVSVWTEYFAANSGGLSSCAVQPNTTAQFTLAGNGNTLKPSLISAHVADGPCHNTYESLLAPTTIRQSFGGAANDYLAQGQNLAPGQQINSPDGHTWLANQTDGNLVVYHNGVALWATHTQGTKAGLLAMQTDGNLVLYTPPPLAPRWASNTPRRVVTTLEVQNDCNVVLYQNGVAIWDTQTAGCVNRL